MSKNWLDNVDKAYTEANMFEFALDYFERFKDDYAVNGCVSVGSADMFLSKNIKKFDSPKQTDKEKLYSYYHKVVLRQHAVRAFRAAGYVGEDEVSVSYRLEAMFAKIYLKKPDGTFDIGIEPKHRMSKDRLLTFVVDVIHFLETELGEMVSDSEEFKAWKATGKKLSKVK